MEWKNILALAVLSLPLAYCTIQESDARWEARKAIETACIQQRGEIGFDNTCVFD